MTRPALLNNIDHRDLRVKTDRAEHFGDAVMSAVTFPAEFRSVQAHYPIVFQKTADGTGFQPLALFGFEAGENLFLGSQGWDAPYVPMAIERDPFLIGRDGDSLLMHVDLDSPRLGVNGAGGEALFRAHGGTTDYLDRMNSVLLALHEGLQATPAFITTLLELRLLESFVFDVELDDGSTHRLAGFYTIDEDRLAALDGAVLERLQRAGQLMPIYMAVASLSNFRTLVERRNRRS
ncbi:SapC family protein [Aquincola sp. S2]|uniref:SapC family protein n=1 Tax=Pseudaquabacterium terrae TaxID=2732868 RepID=A0ABX2EAC5_9BURK|nr:SapC family protein [Aquabacterium terrae]NRF65775.1 SapC family protein [Aquabacterium terrae]